MGQSRAECKASLKRNLIGRVPEETHVSSDYPSPAALRIFCMRSILSMNKLDLDFFTESINNFE